VPRRAGVAGQGARQRTVLVVEDMAYFREIAEDALSSRYEVRSVANLDEARAAISAGGIDLIVLDLTLDGGDHGFELLRSMTVKPCPIVIFTAQDESEMYGDTWNELRGLGADDLVIKGMNVGESLQRKVATLLGEQWDEGE
jgi:DNA-binding response OmpR family regulator